MPKGNQTVYEWLAEGISQSEDVEELVYADSFARAVDAAKGLLGEYPRSDIGLERRVYDWTGDLIDRQYAYVYDGELEAEFDGGAKVPKRFMDEFSSFAN